MKGLVKKWNSISLILRILVGFIIGVVQDSLETAINSGGDVMFAAVAEFHDRMKREQA